MPYRGKMAHAHSAEESEIMWRASHFLHFIFLPFPSFPPFIMKEPQSGVTYHTSMAGKGLMYQGVDTKGSSRVAGRFATKSSPALH